MVGNTSVIGTKESNMAKGFMSILKEKRNMANGNMARESDGLKTEKRYELFI